MGVVPWICIAYAVVHNEVNIVHCAGGYVHSFKRAWLANMLKI